MKNKELQLMKYGMKLFAQKGYHNTSIQEIATAASMSKGSFYLYFQSKEDFITRTIHYHYEEITHRIQATSSRDDLNPKESMAAQIAILVDYVYTYKDFIMMHVRENIPAGQHTDQLMWQMKVENFHWLKDNLQAIYRDTLGEYFIDATIQCDGLLNGYFKWMVMDDINIDPHVAGSYLIKRIDNLVNGMLAQEDPPLISWEALPDAYKMEESGEVKEKLMIRIDELKQMVDQVELSQDRKAQLNEAADIILNELLKDTPRMIMVQGMLAHFRPIAELGPLTEEIANLLDVELLQ
ncbi:TetR/AcrR family transcriptional regulator [Lentibacillus saliphilus]|uniref:TetR/AcrR family transcriptional regulator n=1 Tax=Lentibacillus saliphilus TaxID=2737028 RepID=UPI001C307D6F|nr:TetR/AcrR family transcriptional regulator [Lentibacillus saliphilus]